MRITNADGTYDQTYTMDTGSSTSATLMWRKPTDAKGPFVVTTSPDAPFKMIVRWAVIGEGLTDGAPAVPPDPNSAEYRTIRKDLKNIESALARFKLDVGRLPTTDEGIEALMTRGNIARGWNGPYLKPWPTDPWARPYIYRCPGLHNPKSFDLKSIGPDCVEGTVDDVGNWPLPKVPANALPQPPLLSAAELQ